MVIPAWRLKESEKIIRKLNNNLISTRGFHTPPRNAGRKSGADACFTREPRKILVSRENCCHLGPASRWLLAVGATGKNRLVEIMDAGSESIFHSGPASRWLRLLNKNPCRNPRPLAAGSFIAFNFMPKNKRIFYIVILFLIFGFIVPELGFPRDLFEKDADDKEEKPVEVTSDRMRSEEGGEKIIFSGNVVGTWGNLTITSDILEIYNSKESNSQTDEIVAIGNVFITKEKKRARGDRAVYLDKLQKIILTGKPHATAWEEKNIIEGKEMIFLLEEDRFVVNKKVRMKLFPKKKQKQARKKNGPKSENKAWVDAKK